MPNFDCGGERCGRFSCSSCTDEKTQAEYWKVLSTCRSDAEADQIMRERLAKKRLAKKRCARCDAALTCAVCDARFDDLLKQNAQLKEALAALLPRHSSWCMGHMGGVKDGVGIGPLVVTDCRCDPNVQRARALLGKD